VLAALAAIGLAGAFQPSHAPGLVRPAGVRGGLQKLRMKASDEHSAHRARRGVIQGGLGAALFAAPALAQAIDIGPSGVGNPTEINGQLLDKSAECQVSERASEWESESESERARERESESARERESERARVEAREREWKRESEKARVRSSSARKAESQGPEGARESQSEPESQ